MNKKPHVRRDEVSSKLLQLNLHRATDSCHRLMRLFDDYRRKRCNYIASSVQRLAEMAGEISDMFNHLYQMCFCVNAISGGKDIDCYHALDQIKGKVNACFDTHLDRQTKQDSPIVPPSERGDNAVLVDEVAGHVLERTFADTTIAGVSLDECGTAHDLMVYCCNRLLHLLEQQLAISRAKRLESGEDDVIVPIPVGYLDEEHEQYAIAFGLDFSTTDCTSPFRVAELLVNGIKAVVSHGYCEPLPERPETKAKHDGLLFYSVDTITLFYVTNRFVSVVTGNVCDVVGGNYLNLLITPVADNQQHGLNHILIRKLLHWLDFDTYVSGSMTVAALKNMTRYDMENHLTVLGKLLCFVSGQRVLAEDEPSLDRNVELFLESVV